MGTSAKATATASTPGVQFDFVCGNPTITGFMRSQLLIRPDGGVHLVLLDLAICDLSMCDVFPLR